MTNRDALDALKPCPFCKTGHIVESNMFYSHKNDGEICPLGAVAWNKDSNNFKAWNTRAALQEPTDSVVMKRDLVEEEILPRLKYKIKAECYCRSQDEGYDEDTFCNLCKTISILETAMEKE